METTNPKPVRPVAAEHSEAAQPTPPAGGRGRRAFIVLGAIVGVALIIFGLYALVTHGTESTDDAQVEADVVPIAARVSGQVLAVKVQENQTVKKGDVLLLIDDADYAARSAQAEAELATAQAQAQAAEAQEQVVAANAKGGLHSAQAMVSGSSVAVYGADAQILSAKAALERAQAEARKAEIDLGRAKQLRAANAVPQERLDNAQIGYDSAQAALAQAQAGLAAAEQSKRAAQSRVLEAEGHLAQSTPIEAQIAAAHAQADLARARVKAAEAAVTLAHLQLSYTQVTAPADGFISKLGAHEGQLVSPGMPIGELVPSATYVVANFKETQIGDMRPGDPVEISVDAFPHAKLKGKVESLSGGTGARFSLLPPDNASGNFVKVVQRVPVRIAWTDVPKDLPLRAGLSADVTVTVKGH